MKKTVIAALLGATLLTGGAMAAAQDQPQRQDAPQRHRMMRDPLMMADANKDGIVTRDEVTAAVTARFTAADTNKDGTISPEEHQAVREAMRGKMAARMGQAPGAEAAPGAPAAPPTPRMRRGKGPAGPVTLDQQRADALEMFDFVDRNGDGKVDQAERQLVHKMMRKLGGDFGRGKGRRHHRGDMAPLPPPAG